MLTFTINWEVDARWGSVLAALGGQKDTMSTDYQVEQKSIVCVHQAENVSYTVTSLVGQAPMIRVFETVLVQHLSDINVVKDLVQQRIGNLKAEVQDLTRAKEVAAGALIIDRQLLIAQRSYPPELAGLWELPGGKVEPGESVSQALAREWQEELGVAVAIGPQIGADVRLSPERVLRAYEVAVTAGQLWPTEHLGMRWVDAAALTHTNMVKADQVWIPDLMQRLE